MPVSKGVSTYAALIGAIATFGLAIATFLETFNELDPLAGLGPLLVAGGVLWKMIDSRGKQATALASRPPAPAPVTYATSGTASTTAPALYFDHTATTFQYPRPGVEGEFTREPKSPPPEELRDLHENGET
jgi:hypothetical protein